MARERQPFLVDRLVCSTVTLIYGEPFSGKSTIAAALAAASLKGQPFLGHPLMRAVDRVVILSTEVDGPEEYGQRLTEAAGLNPINAPVDMFSLPSLKQDSDWRNLAADIAPQKGDLIILDNLTGVVHPSVNDDSAIRQVFDGLRYLTAAGATVVVVAHISEKRHEGRASTKPMGSTAISAGVRWRVRVGARADEITLTCDGNAAKGLILRLRRGERLTDFEVVEEQSAEAATAERRERDREKGDRLALLADWVVQNHPSAKPADLGRLLVEQAPWVAGGKNPARQVARYLSEGRGVGGFLERRDGVWCRRGVA
jgi:hypothetical protein